MSTHATQPIRRVLVEGKGTAVSWAGQISVGGILLVLAISVPVSAKVLDHLNVGVAESERAREVTSQGSELLEIRQIGVAVPYVAGASASAGTAPEATLVEPGEWGVHREGEWIQYALSQPVNLGRLQVEWGRNQAFLFEIHVSLDGKTWKNVFAGRSWRRGRGHLETCSFEPVEAQYVRIVAGGRDTPTRKGRFFVGQVRLGDLVYPDAYQPALAYQPGLGQPCRRLLPVGESWEGGSLSFTMRCVPEGQNYLTVKLWGSDSRQSYFYLRDADGCWVLHAPEGAMRGGYNAAWTPLWEFAEDTAGGPCPGRFVYVTYPIPENLISGKSRVRLQLQAAASSIGSPMKVPSQGIYDVYTHTEPFSAFAGDEPQGEPFRWGPSRPMPEGQSVDQKLLRDARQLIAQLIEGQRLATDDYRGLIALTQAYHAPWSEHHKDEKIVRIVCDTIDGLIQKQAAIGKGPLGIIHGTGAWHIHGNLAHCLNQVYPAFEAMGMLDAAFHYRDGAPTSGPTANRDYVRRRDAYAVFFQEAFEWRRSEAGGRRRMSNQTISVDRALYRMNRALQKLEPELAISEETALNYLYESTGMRPFFQGWPRHDWVRETAFADYPFYVVSYKGLTKEGGMASHYGEAVSRFARLAGEVGDPKLTERVRQMAEARATMCRRPDNDAAGYAVLRGPATYSWRGRYYPGAIRYAPCPFIQAAVLQDPISLRTAELYLEHGRVFAEGEPRINQIVPRVEAYRKVKELLPTDARLPMEPEHGDFGWADEDVAVFAVKHGDTRINGSFFLSRDAVFPIGRIHFTTPRIERLATVKVDTVVSPSGGTFTMPEKLPGGRISVLGGQQYAIQPPPPGLVEKINEAGGELWRDGDERAFMADLYRVRFGDYLIAMNTTLEGTYREQTFEIDAPPGRRQALDLISGRMVDLSRPVKLGPRSTIVLYLGDEKPAGRK